MGSGKARTTNTLKAKKWRPRTEPITEFGRWYRDMELPVTAIIDELECAKGYAYELLAGSRMPSIGIAVMLIEMADRYDDSDHIWAGSFLPDDLAT